MTQQNKTEFETLISELLRDDRTCSMKNYIQHGRITTFDHAYDVAHTSYRLHLFLKWGTEPYALVRGAFLHDYYLYDWHHHKGDTLHGFSHPEEARRNALRDFSISPKEENIIRSHMWPLTLLHPPSCKEAVIVNICDKYCSLKETLFKR